MLINTLRNNLRAEPFEPFVVQLTDGRRFEVPHGDFAALSPNGGELFVYRNTEGDSGIKLSTLLIASVEPLRPATH